MEPHVIMKRRMNTSAWKAKTTRSLARLSILVQSKLKVQVATKQTPKPKSLIIACPHWICSQMQVEAPLQNQIIVPCTESASKRQLLKVVESAK